MQLPKITESRIASLLSLHPTLTRQDIIHRAITLLAKVECKRLGRSSLPVVRPKVSRDSSLRYAQNKAQHFRSTHFMGSPESRALILSAQQFNTLPEQLFVLLFPEGRRPSTAIRDRILMGFRTTHPGVLSTCHLGHYSICPRIALAVFPDAPLLVRNTLLELVGKSTAPMLPEPRTPWLYVNKNKPKIEINDLSNAVSHG